MSQLTIYLAETPNAQNKDFLATTVPLSIVDQNEDELPLEIIVDSYTRESWCRSSDSKSNIWKCAWLKSIDKRERLPGFIQFLKARAKARVGQNNIFRLHKNILQYSSS